MLTQPDPRNVLIRNPLSTVRHVGRASTLGVLSRGSMMIPSLENPLHGSSEGMAPARMDGDIFPYALDHLELCLQ